MNKVFGEPPKTQYFSAQLTRRVKVPIDSCGRRAHGELRLLSDIDRNHYMQDTNKVKSLIRRAMMQQDDLVLVFEYVDSRGCSTRRVVSPIRVQGEDRFLGLCLSREEPRQFYLDRCSNLRVDSAANYVMPVELLSIG